MELIYTDFNGLADDLIGELDKSWNWLAIEYEETPMLKLFIIHLELHVLTNFTPHLCHPIGRSILSNLFKVLERKLKYESKSLGIDIMFPWEVGLIIIILGIILVYIGYKQGKKTDIDIDKLPLTRSTTKLVSGTILIVFGAVQLLPLLGGI